MSTRSAILIDNYQGTGKYAGIYCHADGYFTYNGNVLNSRYCSRQTVEDLIAGGDTSFIDEYDDPAYYGDSGPILGDTEAEVAGQIGHNGWVYTFTDEEGWSINGIPFEDAYTYEDQNQLLA